MRVPGEPARDRRRRAPAELDAPVRRARPGADRLPNPGRQRSEAARQGNGRPVGQRQGRLEPVHPDRLRRQAARIADAVLLEGAGLGQGRQALLLEQAGLLDDGPAESGPVEGQLDRLRRLAPARCATPASWICPAPPGSGHPARTPPAPPRSATRYFRKEFTIPEDRELVSAMCVVTADNSFKMFLNGRRIRNGNSFKEAVAANVTEHLHKGKNVIADRGDERRRRRESCGRAGRPGASASRTATPSPSSRTGSGAARRQRRRRIG